jgi:hypothetical protein
MKLEKPKLWLEEIEEEWEEIQRFELAASVI